MTGIKLYCACGWRYINL